jgi:hypothetical protein
MLTYAFDLLVLIYEEEGYAANDIPGLILKHNLHGVDLCPRAAQLAEMALVFKAREKSRRFFQPEHIVRPNIIELKDIRFEEGELPAYFKAIGIDPSGFSSQPSGLLTLLHQFEEAKNFGSLIQPCLDERTIAEVRRAITERWLLPSDPSSLTPDPFPSGQLFLRETHLKVLRVLEQAEALTQRYHVVVANPPYLGGRQMNDTLKEFAKGQYPDSKADFFSMFIERGFSLVIARGYSAMVTMESWMFLSSFELLRSKLLESNTIHSMVHMPYLGRGATSMGINFGTTATVWAKTEGVNFRGHYQCIRYYECDELVIPKTFPCVNERTAWQTSASFLRIPGTPIAYWISDAFLRLYGRKTLDDYANPRQGLATGNNDRFLKLWHEVPVSKFSADCHSLNDVRQKGAEWVPTTKGGPFRRWYGNKDYVIHFDSENYKALGQSGNKLPSRDFYFKSGATWSTLFSGKVSFRLSECSVFETKGSICFSRGEVSANSLLGFLNSNVTQKLLEVVSPTLDYHEGPLRTLPFVQIEASLIEARVGSLIEIARADWDNFETSWDFRDPPLLRAGLKGATLEASWRNWEAQSTAAIRRMQELETENNRLFIAAYGLEGELQPEVPEEQITLARADVKKDMAAFLSYAVGVMFGRYSLEVPGLVLANAGDTLDDYWRIVRTKDEGRRMNDEGKPAAAADLDLSLPSQSFNLQPSSFIPDPDGILPVLDGEWFEDDIVIRTREFLRATFGEAALNENVQFIEQALGKDLRSYFQDDFFKNHLSGERAYGYKNRPIYWLFSSGKQKAFQCLVYLHRYTPGILSRIRTDYAIPLQGKLSARITRLEEEVPNTTSSAARKKLQTELDKAKKQLVELLAYDEQLRSYADQRIALDLDDGVKVNYAKFGPLVADAKKVCGKKED